VEVKPKFSDGNIEFMKFIDKNFGTPEEEAVSGVIKVLFIVDRMEVLAI